MDFNLFEYAIQYGQGGIFLILFVYAYKQQEKKNDQREKKSEERESKYQELLGQFAQKYDVMSNDIKDIKEELKKGG